MAIFHLDVKTISRSQGRSAVGAAAYRAGARLLDERLGVEYDYSNKKGVVYSEIMAPLDAPEWVKDRKRLWNEVEATEKRKDSQLAREVLIALPKELTQDERVDLIREYCDKQFVSKGMIADVNIHEDNPENPHAHILLTMREVSAKGFGLKNRDWNKRENVFEQRRFWQDIANAHLHLAGHTTRIDCRSLQERGIDLEPGIHLGQAPHHAMNRGEGDDFGKYIDHIEILRANGERLIRDPSAAIEKLTQQQAVFNDYDIAKLANQYSADLNQYQDVLTAIKSSKQIVTLGENEYGKTVYSTIKMITLEHEMLNQAYELDAKRAHQVDLKAANQALSGKSLSESQRQAFSHVINAGDLKIVSGLAGTGKSYLMGAVKEAFEGSGCKVSGICLSGIAAQGLQEGAGIPSMTVDSQLLQWEQGREGLTKQNILVIDEAGMLGTQKLNCIIRYANDAGAKVILVHDTEQLGAIEAGAPSRALAERFGQASLTDVMRQHSPKMRKATFEFATGNTTKALERYKAMGAIHSHAVDEKVAGRLMIEAWAADRLEGKSQLMLAYTNESVKSLNEQAREVRIAAGEIERGESFTVAKGERHFAIGDKVYFLRNDKQLGVKNGSLGIIESISKHQFNIKLDSKDNKSASFDIRNYQHLDHGYAATIHKAQGMTVDKTYVLASKHFDRHLSYVACTRHRESLALFAHHKDFKNEEVLYKTLSRERSKSMAVDFAQARWIEPRNMREAGLNKLKISEQRLAKERLEIKQLNKQFPDRVFSFVRAFEQVKGVVQGMVNLSDNRKMLSVRKKNQSKLVAMSHNFENHQGKQVSIHLDKEGKILNCSVNGQEKIRMASFDKAATSLGGPSQHIGQRSFDDSQERG
ncbi:MAG: Ti-type conjugative transfer relaxase TraA [Gammaproteobacteria bacterium 39-13]|nr:Ti-type conjugative transfer relaxase TraA [Gammaproteobacteria bacterium]OJV92700.1 MAG: Ti-type conjugative transfer relaxase TraA [Gammaproteobacteria bacterium 39-13]